MCYLVLTEARLLGLLETLLGRLEVDDVPNSLEVIGLDVLVLQIEGMFPGVDADQGDVRC